MYHKISENEKIDEIKLITIYKYDTIIVDFVMLI